MRLVRTMISDEKKYLENFLYNKQDLEKLEELIDKFNIFSALNIEHSESSHSNFLSWLLTESAIGMIRIARAATLTKPSLVEISLPTL